MLSKTAVALVIALGFFATLLTADEKPARDQTLKLNVRSQVETAKGSGRFHSITKPIEWDAKRTAIVICDMWDKHWCQGATRRVAEMAPRMNEAVAAARKRGVLIIHCPSDTMDYYKDTPQRKLAQQAPVVETKMPLERWCRLDPKREGALPIDDRDGGCDCSPTCKSGKAWSKQIDAIQIAEGDAITDSAEAYYLMRQRGITNVIVMGVHTNMCVLGRPFSIRQMVYQGQNVLLVRDLTDTMYNSRSAPKVSHFTGTDLVVEHIERHWCPTITSADLLASSSAAARPFRFSQDKRPHVAVIMAEDEYRTNESLPTFALTNLGPEFKLSYVHGDEKDRHNLPGIEVLNEADVAIISVRRRVLPKSQMDVIRKFIAAGKPIIGIRTTSHAFSLSLRGDKQPPDGYEAWEKFDPEVIGGHYTGHHGDGPKTTVTVASGAERHAILRDVEVAKLVGHGSLYKSAPLAKTATPLLIGTIPDKPPEPVVWVYTRADGGKTFYTSLGHIDDFGQPAFRQLLVNAVRWAVKQER